MSPVFYLPARRRELRIGEGCGQRTRDEPKMWKLAKSKRPEVRSAGSQLHSFCPEQVRSIKRQEAV